MSDQSVSSVLEASSRARSINQEQALHELEQKYLNVSADLKKTQENKNQIAAEHTKLQQAYKQVQSSETAKKDQILRLESELLQAEKKASQADAQCLAAQSLAERLRKEKSSLYDTVQDQARELVQLQQQLLEANRKLTAVHTELEINRQALNRVEKEKDSRMEHMEWLESQLKDKNKQLQTVRQSLHKTQAEHEALQLESIESQRSLNEELKRYKERTQRMEIEMEAIREEMKELQSAHVNERAQFESELQAQSRLAVLYKEASDAASVQCEQLDKRCRALQLSLADAKDETARVSERRKQDVQHLFQEQMQASEKHIEALELQLAETSEKLSKLEEKEFSFAQHASDMASLSSTAADAHLLTHKLSAKQLYDQIVELKESLNTERLEKERLEIYLERIVREVEEKAPILKNLHLDYQRACAAQIHMTERLEACMHELDHTKAKEQAYKKEKLEYARKSESLSHTIADLSRQVQHLLFRTQAEAPQSATTSENLVLFKDVSELQIRNQQLLKVIRSLSSAHSSSDTHSIVPIESDDDENVSEEMQKRLEAARKELFQIQSEREQERDMIAAIIKQRDTYRSKLMQIESKGDSEAKTMPIASKDTSSAALYELQSEFETYKKEKQANLKLIQESLTQTQNDLILAKQNQIANQVELKCMTDRLALSQERCKAAEEDCKSLRTKSDRFAELLLQHEKQLTDLRVSLKEESEALHSARVSRDSADRQVAFFQSHVEQIQIELKEARTENSSMLKLMETSQLMHASVEQRSAREIEQLTERIKDAELELHQRAQKMEAQEAIASATRIELEHEKKRLELELQRVNESQIERQERLCRLEEQLKNSDIRRMELESQVQELRDQVRMNSNAASLDRIATLEMQLRSAQREAQATLSHTNDLKENVEQYKAIAEANEKAYQELFQANELLKKTNEERLAMALKEKEEMERDRNKYRNMLKDHVHQENAIRQQLDAVSLKKNEAETRVQQAVQTQHLQAQGYEKQIESLRETISLLTRDLKASEANYERELQLHAQQIAKSAADKLEQDPNQNAELVTAELRHKLACLEKEHATQRTALELELSEAKSAQKALKEQNQLLHSQLQQCIADIERVQRDRADSHGFESTDESVRELRSIVAFLRQENEILSSKYELAQLESKRLQSQAHVLDATILRLRSDLQSVHEARVMEQAPSKAHASLEQLNLLRESNATLREEGERTLVRLKEQINRAESLEQQVEPLRAREHKLINQVQALEEQVQILSQANERWKVRVDQLVEKYQQIDPEEYENVCKQRDELRKDIETCQLEKSALEKELEGARSSEGKSAKEAELMIENLRKQYDQIKGFAKSWKARAEAFSKELVEKKKEVDVLKARLLELEQEMSSSETKAADSTAVQHAALEKERQELREKWENESKRTAHLRDFNNRLLNSMKMLKKENADLKALMERKSGEEESTGVEESVSKLEAAVEEKELSAPALELVQVGSGNLIRESESDLVEVEAESDVPTDVAALAEEKLRQSVLLSMKQKLASQTSETKGILMESRGKPPLPAVFEPKNEEKEAEKEEDAVVTAVKTTTWTFGSGSASGLVFGKPGITLPIPASPTVPVKTDLGSVTDGAADAMSDAEEVKRTQRLARFHETEAVAPVVGILAKRPAASVFTLDTIPTLKAAKTSEEQLNAASERVESEEKESDEKEGVTSDERKEES